MDREGLLTRDDGRRGLGEQWHTLLEPPRTMVVLRQLSAHVASVDRLAEHGGLPQRETLEPRQRLDFAAAAFGLARDQLGA